MLQREPWVNHLTQLGTGTDIWSNSGISHSVSNVNLVHSKQTFDRVRAVFVPKCNAIEEEHLLDGEPGAEALKRAISCAESLAGMEVTVWPGATWCGSPACPTCSGGALCSPSGIGLPSRDRLSGVNVPTMPR